MYNGHDMLSIFKIFFHSKHLEENTLTRKQPMLPSNEIHFVTF